MGSWRKANICSYARFVRGDCAHPCRASAVCTFADFEEVSMLEFSPSIKSATTLKSIERQQADTRSLVDSWFSTPLWEDCSLFETSMIRHPGKTHTGWGQHEDKPRLATHFKVSQVRQRCNTLILNLPLTPQLWSNVKQQTVNFVRGRWIRKANSRHARGYVVVLCVHNINLESNWPVLWQLQLLWLCAHLEDCWASSWHDVLASAPGGGWGGVRGVKRHGKLSQVTNRIENRWTNAHKNPKSTLKKVYLVR